MLSFSSVRVFPTYQQTTMRTTIQAIRRFYRPRERVGKGFTHVCLSVCPSVCPSVCVSVCVCVFPADNFWTNQLIDLIFGTEVGHHNI